MDYKNESDKILLNVKSSGIISKHLGFAQQLYQEVTGDDYPKHVPHNIGQNDLSSSLGFAHSNWAYPNEIKQGVTLAEQSAHAELG